MKRRSQILSLVFCVLTFLCGCNRGSVENASTPTDRDDPTKASAMRLANNGQFYMKYYFDFVYASGDEPFDFSGDQNSYYADSETRSLKTQTFHEDDVNVSVVPVEFSEKQVSFLVEATLGESSADAVPFAKGRLNVSWEETRVFSFAKSVGDKVGVAVMPTRKGSDQSPGETSAGKF